MLSLLAHMLHPLKERARQHGKAPILCLLLKAITISSITPKFALSHTTNDSHHHRSLHYYSSIYLVGTTLNVKLMPILRKNLHKTKHGRTTQCCWILEANKTGDMGEDVLCGQPTKKTWNEEEEIYNYAGFCDFHQEKADEQDRLDIENEE